MVVREESQRVTTVRANCETQLSRARQVAKHGIRCAAKCWHFCPAFAAICCLDDGLSFGLGLFLLADSDADVRRRTRNPVESLRALWRPHQSPRPIIARVQRRPPCTNGDTASRRSTDGIGQRPDIARQRHLLPRHTVIATRDERPGWAIRGPSCVPVCADGNASPIRPTRDRLEESILRRVCLGPALTPVA